MGELYLSHHIASLLQAWRRVIKPEVAYKTLHCRQNRTEPRRQTGNLVKLVTFELWICGVWSTYLSRHNTDKDALIAALHCPPWCKVTTRHKQRNIVSCCHSTVHIIAISQLPNRYHSHCSDKEPIIVMAACWTIEKSKWIQVASYVVLPSVGCNCNY